MLSNPAVRIFIAEEDGNAVGYIVCKLIERPENPFTVAMHSLHIDQVSVRPAAHGRGVGTALMHQAELLGKEWGLHRIQLDSRDFNINAHRFFEHLGFRKYDFRFWRNM